MAVVHPTRYNGAENGLSTFPVPLTESELGFMDMVRRWLVDSRIRKATGKLTFEADLQDGGITAKWAGPRFKER